MSWRELGTSIEHGVEVEAETLYEGAVKALCRIKQYRLGTGINQSTRLRVEVVDRVSEHELSVGDVYDWLDRHGKLFEVAKRKTLRDMLDAANA